MNALPERVRAPFEGPLMTIARLVAQVHGVSIGDLRGRRQSRTYTHPRQMAFYLAASLTGKSHPEIGRFFDRDHTTVLHGVRAFGDRMARDPELMALTRRIEAHPDLKGLADTIAEDAFRIEEERFRARLEDLLVTTRLTLERLNSGDVLAFPEACRTCPHARRRKGAAA